MPNTREKLIDLRNGTPNVLISKKASVNIADLLIANGVRLEEKQAKKTSEENKRTIPTRCEHCQCSDTISCPAGRVWCGRMMRYMKLDAFCSEGKSKEEYDGKK